MAIPSASDQGVAAHETASLQGTGRRNRADPRNPAVVGVPVDVQRLDQLQSQIAQSTGLRAETLHTGLVKVSEPLRAILSHDVEALRKRLEPSEEPTRP